MRKAALLIFLLGFCTAMAAERNISHTFDVEPNATFSLDSHKGHIQVRTDNVRTIEVYARIYMQDGEQAGSEALYDHTHIKIRNDKRYVTIEVEYDNDAMEEIFKGLLGRHQSMPAVDFDVVLPDDSNLRLESHKSTFDVDAPAGEVKIESHKGTGQIRQVRSDFQLFTHKGDFDVEILKLNDLEIETHKGDVRVHVQSETGFYVRGSSHKGTLSFSGYDIPVEKDRGSSRVSHRVGSGEHRVELETHKGRIALDFPY